MRQCSGASRRQPSTYFCQPIVNPSGTGGLGGLGGCFGFGGFILDGFILGPLGFLSGTGFRFQGMVISFLGFTIISPTGRECPAETGIDVLLKTPGVPYNGIPSLAGHELGAYGEIGTWDLVGALLDLHTPCMFLEPGGQSLPAFTEQMNHRFFSHWQIMAQAVQ